MNNILSFSVKDGLDGNTKKTFFLECSHSREEIQNAYRSARKTTGINLEGLHTEVSERQMRLISEVVDLRSLGYTTNELNEDGLLHVMLPGDFLVVFMGMVATVIKDFKYIQIPVEDLTDDFDFEII